MTDVPAAKPGLSRVLSPLAVAFLTFSALSPVMSVYLAGDALLHIAGAGAALAVVAGGVIVALIARCSPRWVQPFLARAGCIRASPACSGRGRPSR